MDIRIPVGAIFAIYGVMLVAWGIVAGDVEARHMINGLNVNVWSGAGMFVFGAVMLLLARRSPTGPRSTSDQPAEPRRGH